MAFENLGIGDLQIQTSHSSTEGGLLFVKGLVHCLSFKTLFKIIWFVIVNTKLVDGDERLEFLESMRTVQIVERNGEKWLAIPNHKKP